MNLLCVLMVKHAGVNVHLVNFLCVLLDMQGHKLDDDHLPGKFAFVGNIRDLIKNIIFDS